MKLQHLTLIAALFVSGAAAQDASELTPEQILERFEAQIAKQRADRLAAEEGLPGLPAPPQYQGEPQPRERLQRPRPQLIRVEHPAPQPTPSPEVTRPAYQELGDDAESRAAIFHEEVAKSLRPRGPGMPTLTPGSHGLISAEYGEAVGMGRSFRFTENGEPVGDEVRMLRFDSASDADTYLMQGSLETTVNGDFALEQRGEWVAVVASPGVKDPTFALEALREAWNALAKAEDRHDIAPVSTRYAKLGDTFVLETESENEELVRSYDNLNYAESPLVSTEHADGVRRIHYGDGSVQAYGEAFELTDADRSPLRSRADEGRFGRTRGLTLGGARSATPGVGNVLQDAVKKAVEEATGN